MNKRYLPSFLVFLFITIILFTGGLFGSFYYARCLYLSIILNNSVMIEKGIVSHISIRNRTFNQTIHFSLRDPTRVYKKSIFKLFTQAKVGDELDVVFNSKHNFYIIRNYILSTYITYIISILLCLLFFSMFFLTGKVVIGIYREMSA